MNKTEGMQSDTAVAEFHELGLGDAGGDLRRAWRGRARAHGTGALEVPRRGSPDEKAEANHPRVAVVGRPNVGKSTLVNALVGEERVIAFDQPGTTRDPIEVPFERGGRRYTLIDTAGLRRRGKTGEAVEYFSIVKALQSIEESNVAILLLDASTGVTEQDAHVAGYILERGRAVVLAVNKWDAADKEARERMKMELAWKLGFLNFAETHFVSAKEGKGLAPADALGRRRLRRGDGAPADAEADARADRRGGAPGAAEERALPAEAALRPPGRHQSAAHHHPRQLARPGARVLQALPRRATSATPSASPARR